VYSLDKRKKLFEEVAKGRSISEVTREMKISRRNYYNWGKNKEKYGS
jgi:transposase